MLWLVKKNQGERKMSVFRDSKQLVLIGLILLATSGAFAEDTGKLIGKVTDAQIGVGLPGAKVIALGTNIEATTDTGGSYEILNVPWRTYTLRASKSDYSSASAFNVRVIGGMTTRQDFILGTGESHAVITPDLLMVKKPEQRQPGKKATGMIIGKVTDAVTGDALPGSRATLVGTKFSDNANVVGDYYIINVPPGTYVLSAEMLGYEKPEMIEVRILQNNTTVKNFKLQIEAKYLDRIKHPY